MAISDRDIEFLVSGMPGRGGSRTPCPEDGLLASLSEGSVSESGREILEAHMAECEACRALLAALAAEPGEAAAPLPGARSSVTVVDGGRPGNGPAEGRDGAAPMAAAVASPAPGDSGRHSQEGGTDEVFPRPFGPYSIVRRLGAGGMGVVYEAVHRQRRRPEALKVLKGGLGNLPGLVERFHREVEAMANLSHDHVVRLYDSGMVDGEMYYTMPLLPGTSLEDLVREVSATGEFPPAARANEVLDRFRIPPLQGAALPPEVAYVKRIGAALAGVADALAVMHARGFFHRDLKPGNLLIDEHGRVLVSDFGLVRWGDQRITRTGQTLGTPAYMSPEQVISDGEEPDGRMDVFAMGATMYELLALRLPHAGETGLDTIRRKLSSSVDPLRGINPAVPVDMETLVGRCLERRRQNRPTAVLLREELERFARGEPVRVQPVSRVTRTVQYASRHRLPLGVAAAALLAVGGWVFSRPAYLTVASLPAARLLVDGTDMGTTPVAALRIPPGAHELRLERERFATYVKKFDVGRGSTFELDRGLQALDPADPEALRVVAAAAGLQVTEVRVEVSRGAEDGSPDAVLFPRGAVREAPASVRVWNRAGGEGLRAVLEPAKGGEALATWSVPAAEGRQALEVAPEVRGRMKGGESYRVRLLDATGAARDAAEFALLDAAGRTRVSERLASLGRGFEAGSPTVEFLRVEYLMGQRLYEDAYERTVALGETLGPRREVARTALAVLDQAGLRERGWWSAWVGLHQQAGK